MSLKESEALVLAGIAKLDSALYAIGLAIRNLDGLTAVATDTGRAVDTDLAIPSAQASMHGLEAEQLFVKAIGPVVGALRALTGEGVAQAQAVDGDVATAKVLLGNVIDILQGPAQKKLQESNKNFLAARERAVTLANILGR